MAKYLLFQKGYGRLKRKEEEIKLALKVQVTLSCKNMGLDKCLVYQKSLILVQKGG